MSHSLVRNIALPSAVVLCILAALTLWQSLQSDQTVARGVTHTILQNVLSQSKLDGCSFGTDAIRIITVDNSSKILCDSYGRTTQKTSKIPYELARTIREMKPNQWGQWDAQNASDEHMLFVWHKQPEHTTIASATYTIPSHIQQRQVQNRVLLLLLAVAGLIAVLVLGLQRIGQAFNTLTQDLQDGKILGEYIPRFDHGEIARLDATIHQKMRDMKFQLDQALEDRNELGFLLQSMVDAVLIFGPDRRLKLYNQAAAELLLLGRIAIEQPTVEMVSRNRDFVQWVDRLLAHDTTAASEEVAYTDDHERTLLCRGTTVEWHEQNNALLILQDVTELRKLETVRTDFVANVSHELRTPLTTIIGYGESLEDLDDLPPKTVQKFIQKIVKNATRLEAIVTDLLALANIERGDAIEKDRLDLGQLATQVVEESLEQTPERTIVLHKPLDAVLCCANEGLIHNAMSNLIQNAVKYSPDQAVTTVTVFQEQGQVGFEVADQGPGIPEEHQDRIFERFYRTEASRSRELGGTGLGLSIVKNIAVAHQGSVELHSDTHGSVFRFVFPKGL